MQRLAIKLPTIPWQEYGMVVAVSGGADSTALLLALMQEVSTAFQRYGLETSCGTALNHVELKDDVSDGLSRIRQNASGRPIREKGTRCLAVCHVNHGLRGRDSDEDSLFVRKLAEKLGLRCFEHRITPDEWDIDATGSVEAAARNIRYDFLLKTAHRLGFRYIATAHTADDQVETVLHRILRGTGVGGLAGMAWMRPVDEAVTLIRPMLHVRRAEIIEYLRERGQTWRTDATNDENDFTRNKIRNILLPQLRQFINPKVEEAVGRLARLAWENETVVSELVENFLDGTAKDTGYATEWDCRHLQRFSSPTLRKIFCQVWKKNNWPLRDMGTKQWENLVEFFLQGKGRRNFPGQIEARHEKDRFILQPIPPQVAADTAAQG